MIVASATRPFIQFHHISRESGMYGLIVKLTVLPGGREEMIGILTESATDMPGCFS
jgi:hypothetical protein